jgi:hypothetical protein
LCWPDRSYRHEVVFGFCSLADRALLRGGEYFWADAHQDGMLDGRHDYSAYDCDFFQEIIMRYGPFGGKARGIASNVLCRYRSEIELYSERQLTIVRIYELGAAFQINPDFGASLRQLGQETYANLGDGGRRLPHQPTRHNLIPSKSGHPF